MNKVYIIGVGLIGGSLALDIKSKDQNIKIFGLDNREEHLDEAIRLKVIDEKATYKDLYKADLVILSIPVDAAVIELPKILDAISDTTLVIDVGSTKSDICLNVSVVLSTSQTAVALAIIGLAILYLLHTIHHHLNSGAQPKGIIR